MQNLTLRRLISVVFFPTEMASVVAHLSTLLSLLTSVCTPLLSTVQLQPERVGCRRPEEPPLVLAQLLRDDGRAHLGRRLGGQAQAAGLQEGAAPAAAGGGEGEGCKLST